MRFAYLLILTIFVSACSDSARERKYSAMPPELEGCRVFYLTNSDGNSMTVARCPNSTTATATGGKNSQTTVTIDVVEYAPIVKRR